MPLSNKKPQNDTKTKQGKVMKQPEAPGTRQQSRPSNARVQQVRPNNSTVSGVKVSVTEVPIAKPVQTKSLQAKQDSEKRFWGIKPENFIAIIAQIFTEIAEAGDSVPLHPTSQQVSIFHTKLPPPISIRTYLQRVVAYSYCSPECFLLALIYLDRIVSRNPKFYISSMNIHRLLITSVMVAAKFYDDTQYNNHHFARVAGVSLQMINSFELEFLFLVNYKLHVTAEQFDQYRIELLENAPLITSTSSCPPQQDTAQNSKDCAHEFKRNLKHHASTPSSPSSNILLAQ